MTTQQNQWSPRGPRHPARATNRNHGRRLCPSACSLSDCVDMPFLVAGQNRGGRDYGRA